MSGAVKVAGSVSPAAPALSKHVASGSSSHKKRRVPQAHDNVPDEPSSDGVVRRTELPNSGSAVLKRSVSERRGLGGGTVARQRSLASGVPKGRPNDVCFDVIHKRAYVLWHKLGSGTYGNVYAAHRYVADERPTFSAADMFERAAANSLRQSDETASEERSPTGPDAEILTARQLIEAAALYDGPLSPRLKRSRSISRSPTPTAFTQSDEWRSRSAHVAPWEAYAEPNCVFKMLRKTDNKNNKIDDEDLIEELQREFYTVRLLIEHHGRRNVEPRISRPLDFVVEYDTLRERHPNASPLTEDERVAQEAQRPPIVRAGLVYAYHPKRIDLNRWMRTFLWQTWSNASKAVYWATAPEISARILDALGLLHSIEIVHRDVKAANVLVTPRHSNIVPDIHLTDFGFSFALRPNDTLRRFKLEPDYLVDSEIEYFIDEEEIPRSAMRYNTTYFVRDPATFAVRTPRPPPHGWPALREKDAAQRVHDRLFPVEEARTAFPAFDIFAAGVVIQRLFDPADYPREPAHFEIRETERMPPDSLIHILRDMTRCDYNKRKTAREYALQLRVLASKLQLKDEAERFIAPPSRR